MPTITIGGYKFRFYSSDRSEPPHVHVLSGESVAKVWLPTCETEYNYGYSPREIGRITQLCNEHRERLLEAWNAYFSR